MYWVNKQLSDHSRILIKDGDKEYHPYLAEDLGHDQAFAATSINEMLMYTDLETGSTVVTIVQFSKNLLNSF